MTTILGTTDRVRRLALCVVTCAAVLVSTLVAAAPADAATVGQPVTYEGATYATSVQKPTADKPQSKLWYADGSWWALMVSPVGNLVHIFELRADHTWWDTGTLVDDRLNSTGDALWVPRDNKLHVVSRTSTTAPRVDRFSFNPANRTWSKDAGYPITLSTGGGSESATIEQDTTRRLWVTYTRASKLWVSVSDSNGQNWTAGFRPQVPDTDLTNDDISSVIAFNGHIGVLWSDQGNDVVRFAIHTDGQPLNVWAVENALAGQSLADDHMNLKQLAGDKTGRIFAAVKTSNGDLASDPPTAPLVGVLVRQPLADGTGDWSFVVAGTVADDHTRPIIMIDETNQELYFFATAPVSGGDIFYKKTSLANPQFDLGRGQPFVNSTKVVNNATGAKHPVNAQTGLVILASADGAHRYVHAEMLLAGSGTADTTPPSQPTGLTATAGAGKITLSWSPSTDNVGVTGYTLRRHDGVERDLSTPGYTDTLVTAGTYSYTVEAIDLAGNRSPASASAAATVPEQPPASGPISLRAVTSAANTAQNTLVVPVPSSQAGDLLLASVDVRGKSTITAPAGWTPLRTDIVGTAMSKATYWKSATATEPAGYTWTLSASATAVGVMMSYSGVSTSAPIEAVNGQVATAGTAVTAPSVQASSTNTRLVALFGVARSADLSAPPGLVEQTEVDSSAGLAFAVTAAIADGGVAGPGATGNKVASSSAAGPNVGHLVALRPAEG